MKYSYKLYSYVISWVNTNLVKNNIIILIDENYQL
jgi:hypothetical protein